MTLLFLALTFNAFFVGAEPESRLDGHVAHESITHATDLGAISDRTRMDLTVTLPFKDQAGLDRLIQQLYDPSHPSYHQFLTPQDFAASYGPQREDLEAVRRHFESKGFHIAPDGFRDGVLRITADASKVQKALGIHIHRFQSRDREFFATMEDPSLPVSIGQRIKHIAGLNNIPLVRPRLTSEALSPELGAGGPLGGLLPYDISKAYGFPGEPLNGSGQVVALFELDGYDPQDVATYNQTFNLRQVPLETILVGGADGVPGSDALEVTMDIEMVNAVAPGLKKILVYEGINTESGILDTYRSIATDGRASVVSTSWGRAEVLAGRVGVQRFTDAESDIFRQMAAQGQTIFAASGDQGAYDGAAPVALMSTDDPASQPYVTGVGGTTLSLDLAGQYLGEQAWNGAWAGSSGGGVSQLWPVPPYQSGIPGILNHPLTGLQGRNVPDVSLNADLNPGYAAFQGQRWRVVGGTSCGSPLWAGFTAILNQYLQSKELPVIGFMNPLLYRLSQASSQTSVFHDIAVGNNFYSPAPLGFLATPGYDPVTGLGSLKASTLLSIIGGMMPQTPIAVVPSAFSTALGNKVLLSTAGGNGSGSILFKVVSGACKLNGNELSNTSAGICSVTATKLSDGLWTPVTSVPVWIRFNDVRFDGSCGLAANTLETGGLTPELLCASGTADGPTLDMDGRYHWICAGSLGGVSASCYSSNGKLNQMPFWLMTSAPSVKSGRSLKIIARGGTGSGKITFKVISLGNTQCRYSASGSRLTLKPRGAPGGCVISAGKGKGININATVSAPLRIDVQ